MTYYKLVSGELIVDAICDDDARWIVENRHNYSTFTGSQAEASGVLSSDGSKVWHIEGKPAFHDFPQYPTVQLVEVEQVEYDALIEELTANGAINVPGDPMDDTSPGADDAQRVAKLPAIAALEKMVAELLQQNEMLTECLLEMSEVVYGE